jgi:hypothetical protein
MNTTNRTRRRPRQPNRPASAARTPDPTDPGRVGASAPPNRPPNNRRQACVGAGDAYGQFPRKVTP